MLVLGQAHSNFQWWSVLFPRAVAHILITYIAACAVGGDHGGGGGSGDGGGDSGDWTQFCNLHCVMVVYI